MQRSLAGSLASLSEAERAAFLDALPAGALAAMPWIWELWSLPAHQTEPEGDWRTWLIMGGRGAGKTRAGAEWVRAQVEGSGPFDAGRCRRLALVGATLDEARRIMVEGESGLLAVSPPDRRPTFRRSDHRLVWPNGAEAQLFSGASPDGLRGPQFDGAWSDELAKWTSCDEAWANLQFCLRLGARPRQIVTTTPRPGNAVLKRLLADDATAVTRAPTAANAANLAAGFVERLTARYGGQDTARQELLGELLEESQGALWTRASVEAGRRDAVPELERIVVAVDPPGSSGRTADECGIVVAGRQRDGAAWRFFVLEDASVAQASPAGWAGAAAEAYRRHDADRIVAEANQGGEMVEAVLRQVDPLLPVTRCYASRGKARRAEPVAALYEQGRVHHAGVFPALEDQMCTWTGAKGEPSPDRMDALVWALTALMETAFAPQCRML